MKEPRSRRIEMDEPRSPPADSILFAILALLPFPGGALLAWTAGDYRQAALVATVLWGAAILCFLAGVRRGVSFRTPGGATAGQIGWMLAHFFCAFAALALLVFPAFAGARPAAGTAALLLAAGYASIGIVDLAGARRGTMPLHFVALRPWQSLTATLSLLALTLTAYLHP